MAKSKSKTKITKVKPSGEPDFDQTDKRPEPKQEEPRAQSVLVRFRGPGIGILAGKQALPTEVHAVSWPQWLAVKGNNKYERVDA